METNHNSFHSIESVIEKTEEYAASKVLLMKYQAIDKISDILSDVLSGAVVVAIFIPFFALMNIGICIWLGRSIQNLPLAFIMVSGFYLILGIIILSIRKRKIKPKVADLIIRQALK